MTIPVTYEGAACRTSTLPTRGTRSLTWMVSIARGDSRRAHSRMDFSAAEEDIQASFRWFPDELAELVNAVETMADGGAGWQRDGVGQSLWSIMVVDPELCSKFPTAIRTCVEAGRIQAAVRLLACYQYLTDNPVEDVDAIMAANPALAEDEMAGWVVKELHEHGSFPVY